MTSSDPQPERRLADQANAASRTDDGFEELGLLSTAEVCVLVRRLPRRACLYLHAVVGLDHDGASHGLTCCIKVSRIEMFEWLTGVTSANTARCRSGMTLLRIRATRSIESGSLFFGTSAL